MGADRLQAFRAAARDALARLAGLVDLGCWAVVRRADDHWVVVEAVDRAYGLHTGSPLPAREAAELGARIVASAGPHHVAAALPGTDLAVVGLDPRSRASLAAELPVVVIVAGLLGALREQEVRATENVVRATRAETDALIDPLTQLGTRLAWNRLLAEEEARCVRTGRPACVVSIDLDGLKRLNDADGHDAGDALLRGAALVLRRTSRMCDHVARVGGDEFAVLAVECDAAAGERFVRRLVDAFAAAGIDASVGVAVRDPQAGLEEAWHVADARMYTDKRARRRARLARALAEPPTQRTDDIAHALQAAAG